MTIREALKIVYDESHNLSVKGEDVVRMTKIWHDIEQIDLALAKAEAEPSKEVNDDGR